MYEITTVLHHYPKKHGLSIEWIADTVGVPKSTLQRYLSLNIDTALPFPLRLLIPFMRACNNDFSALDVVESRVGRTAYMTGGVDIEIDSAAVASFAKEAGEAIRSIAETAEDKNAEDKKRKCTEDLLCLQRITSAILSQLNK